MAESGNSEERAGWELIWQSGEIPPRYRTLAEPNATVVAWADTLLAGGFILDVGCGIGRHCVYLGGLGFKMAGIDVSTSGVKISHEVCAERQIEFDGRVSDMTALPWANSTFDAALSTSTIHHYRRVDIVRALHEVRRVLKPGGLFLVDFLDKNTLAYQQVRDQVVAGELTEVEPDTFVDERPELDRTNNDAFLPHHFSDEADLRDLLRSFEIIKLDVDTGSGKRGKWVAFVRKPLSG